MFVKAEYKLKKERWKKEMDSQDTPKSQRNQGWYLLSLSLPHNNAILNIREDLKKLTQSLEDFLCEAVFF